MYDLEGWLDKYVWIILSCCMSFKKLSARLEYIIEPKHGKETNQ